MSYFKAKMHQIQFPLGLRPIPRWGSLQRSPGPLTVFKGPTSKGRKGKGERRGRERERQKRGKERRREGICWTNVKLLPIRACYK